MPIGRYVALGALLFSFPSQAQELTEENFRPNRTKVIDRFPLPAEPPVRTLKPDTDYKVEDLPAPLAETFTLHSKPDASKIIYLDFNGHQLTYDGFDFYYPPWNMEGSATTFSDTERTIIQLTWQSVAEDFLPFDIDVTTEAPSVDRLKNSGGDDTEWGVRAVINHSTYDYSWAYQNSFDDSDDIELYAWSGNFDSIDETWVWTADSVSHEAGHTLGLSHDGTTRGVEYYTGHGSGETSWSPIMGWTNYGLSQWDVGEYTDANNQQDDVAIITSRNGFGFREDDHGSTAETATAIDIDLQTAATGVIEQRDDLDYFVFSVKHEAHRVITVSPDNLAPNLDIEAKLYDTTGKLLFTANPETSVSAEFDVYLSVGEYVLSVDGTGYEDPTSDGYSDYGSLGYYIIQTDADGKKKGPGDTSDTGESGDSGDTEDTGTAKPPKDTSPESDTSDTGTTHTHQDEKGAGGCGCNAPAPFWPATLLVLPLLIRRKNREHSTCGG